MTTTAQRAQGRTLTREEAAAHEQKLRNLKALKNGDWIKDAGYVRGKDGAVQRSDDAEAAYLLHVKVLGQDAADALDREVYTESFKAWMRAKFPNPWEDRPEIRQHFEDTRERDKDRKLVPFWRRWARFWWEDKGQHRETALPTYAEPRTFNGKGLSWPKPKGELPADDAAHEIGASEKLKGLFTTGSFAQQEVAASLTRTATGAAPAWAVPVPSEGREQRRRGKSGKALSDAARAKKYRAAKKASVTK
jgi:hypothetical protein